MLDYNTPQALSATSERPCIFCGRIVAVAPHAQIELKTGQRAHRACIVLARDLEVQMGGAK